MAEQNRKYNQIRALLAVTKASLLSTVKNPSTLVFSFVFPLVFILIFGFLGNRSAVINAGVIPGSDTTNPVYISLSKNPSVKLFNITDEGKARDDLSKGKIDSIIKFERLQTNVAPFFKIDVTTSGASPQNGALFVSLVNGISDKANLNFAATSALAVKVEKHDIKGRQFKQIDFILPGQLGYSLLAIGVFSTAFVFLRLRETLVLKRFFATPIYKRNILLGEAFSRLIFGIIQGSIIILIGSTFLHFTLINGFTTLLLMLVLTVIGLIVFLGFGLLISGIAKDQNTVPAMANLITLPQFLLSGTFFPIEAFPDWLQPVSRVLPLTYLNDALRKVAFEGVNLIGVSHQIWILLLWGVFIYLLAIRFFKWE